MRLIRRLASLLIRRIQSGAGAGLRFEAVDAGLAYLKGTNEQPVQEALARVLKPGDTFYDVGANLGFFTVIGARLVGPEGRVYAFEPVPRNAKAIRRNAALNQFEHVTVFEQAASHTSGSGELLLTAHSGGATLASTRIVPSDLAGRTTVPLVALDDLVAAGDIAPPDVVKIDVEGAEADVLRGLANTLRSARPILIYELDDPDPDAFQQRREQLDALVKTFGYTIEHLENAYPGGATRVGHAVARPA